MRTIALLVALYILAQSATFAAGHAAAADPMPGAHGGLGCMTDSECEGIDTSDEY